jgi:hypothetical protein
VEGWIGQGKGSAEVGKRELGISDRVGERGWENKDGRAPARHDGAIHRTGKVVTGDSGFCVAVGVMALHEKGMYGQFLIKKRRYWPKHVPGDLIDAHMAGKRLGETETYMQEIDGTCFLVHCCKDADWTTKIMPTHGVLDENQDHPTWQLVNGE